MRGLTPDHFAMTSLQPAGPESGRADEDSQAFSRDSDSLPSESSRGDAADSWSDPTFGEALEPDPESDLGAGAEPAAEPSPGEEAPEAPAKKSRRRSPSRKKSKTSKRSQAAAPIPVEEASESADPSAGLIELASEPLSDPLSGPESELGEGWGGSGASGGIASAETTELGAADNRRSERRRAQPKRRSAAEDFELAVPIEPAGDPAAEPAAPPAARGRRGRARPMDPSERAAPAAPLPRSAEGHGPSGGFEAAEPGPSADRFPPTEDLDAAPGDPEGGAGGPGRSRRRRRARRAWGLHNEQGELPAEPGASDPEAPALEAEPGRGQWGRAARESTPWESTGETDPFPRDPEDARDDFGAEREGRSPGAIPAHERLPGHSRRRWGAEQIPAGSGADLEAPLEDFEAEDDGPGAQPGGSLDPAFESEGGRRGRRRGGRRRRERRERSRSMDAAGPVGAAPARFPQDPADISAPVLSGAVALEAIPGEDLEDLLLLPEAPPIDGGDFVNTAQAPDSDGEQGGEAGGRRRRRRRGRGAAAEAPNPLAPRKLPEVPRDQTILVNAADPEETRVVVVEDGGIVDLQMTVEKHKSFVNDIYRGRVVNLESAIGAAFVDFGQGRNGFLHASDVMDFYGDEDFALERLLTARTEASDWEAKGVQAEEVEDPAGGDARAADDDKRSLRPKRGSAAQKSRRVKRRNITDLLEKGQLVVVQITKDAIGDKGPTLTTYISIPGRYLVLMPSLQRTGVSRKIEDERERRRLKKILQEMEIPEGMGVIVRTAGVGKTSEEIKRDLDYLLAVWEDFSKQLVLGRMPAPLYQESDVAIRTMRDLFSTRTEAVIVDDPKVYEQMLEFTRRLMPEHVERVKLHESTKPLFHAYGVEQDFERIFSRRVELPSGGSIVIDQTEALVAIDVNSGRTRDEGADFEDIALKTNLEAAPEIARQIKLRDMGGILVVDFIDMLRPSSRRQVEKTFAECLDQDRARSKVGRISQFGLLELTRQRLGPGLSKLVYEACPTCKGSGRRRTAQSRAQAVLRRLASALNQKGFTRIDVLAHPDTIHWLEEHDKAELDQLRESFKREIVLREVENQSEDSVFHYLRADGREVRPGGRRKR
jgi:ribonuclease E